MSDEILVTREGRVAVITLNRPDRLNALSHGMIAALIETLERIEADSDVGCVVLTGAGRGFCAGGDVKQMEGRKAMSFIENLDDIRWRQKIPLSIYSSSKVVIGMINGAAMGAGLGIALACDLRFAGRSARFGTAYGKIGFSGDYGISWTLTKLLGSARARELCFTSEVVDADRAEAMGLVTRTVEDADLAATTMEFAQKIASGPVLAYRYMKRNLAAAETQPLADVVEMEIHHQVFLAQTEDHREARQAFAEKRPPRFVGR